MSYYSKFPTLLMGSERRAQIERHTSSHTSTDASSFSANHNIGPYRKGRFLIMAANYNSWGVGGNAPNVITAEGVPLTQLVTVNATATSHRTARLYGAHIPHFQTRSNALNGLSLPRTLSDASWTKSGATISANSTTSPNGIVDADKLVENSATSSHLVSKQTSGINVNQNATMIFYAKKAERAYIYAVMSDASISLGSNSITQFFDIDTGAILGSATSGNGVFADATIEDVGDGWFKCTLRGTVNGSGSSNLYAQVHLSTNGTSQSYTGDGSSGLYVWNMQVSAGTYNSGTAEGADLLISATAATFNSCRLSTFSAWGLKSFTPVDTCTSGITTGTPSASMDVLKGGVGLGVAAAVWNGSGTIADPSDAVWTAPIDHIISLTEGGGSPDSASSYGIGHFKQDDTITVSGNPYNPNFAVNKALCGVSFR